MNAHQDLPVILHNNNRGLLTIEDGRLDVLQLSKDGRPPKRLLSSPTRNFLRAKLAAGQAGQNRRLDLSTLIAKGRHLRLSTMHVLVEPMNVPEAEEWVGVAMQAAYPATKPFRRVLLLVNPVGGKGKSRAIVRDTVAPIFEAAGCIVDTRETTHRLHAEEIVKEAKLDYDVIAPASGDGLIYEVFNGLAERSDAKKALKIPVAPIPTGSANAMCINLFGVKDTFNIELACLNAIKGQTIPKDLCSVLLLPANTRRWSFISVANGLMVDLDIGTENIRWVGDSRFLLGFLKGVAANKNHKCRLRLKVVHDDKVEMAREAREWAATQKGKRVVGGGTDPLVNGVKKLAINGEASGSDGAGTAGHGQAPEGSGPGEGTPSGPGNAGDEDGPVPPSKPLQPDDSWVVIESGSEAPISQSQRETIEAQRGHKGGWINGEGVLYAYAGNLPWVARDLMQWPVATDGQGVVDVVVQSIVPRGTLVSAITGAEKGDAYWMDCQHYYKVSAYTLENLDKANQEVFTIDGEAFPYDQCHVEVHAGAARLCSLEGHLYISDFLQKHDTRG